NVIRGNAVPDSSGRLIKYNTTTKDVKTHSASTTPVLNLHPRHSSPPLWLKNIDGVLELHPWLVSLGTIHFMTQILDHNNTHIAIEAISVIEDLTYQNILDGEENDELLNVLMNPN
ncbi:hypothetical protein ACH5RR_025047, partial [Cinchona calisaya]